MGTDQTKRVNGIFGRKRMLLFLAEIQFQWISANDWLSAEETS